MSKEKKLVELKELIGIAGREIIEKLLKGERDKNVLRIITNMNSEEKTYSEVDFWRRQIQVCNALLKLPTRMIEVDEDIDLGKEIEDQGENLDIGNVNDLFITQE